MKLSCISLCTVTKKEAALFCKQLKCWPVSLSLSYFSKVLMGIQRPQHHNEGYFWKQPMSFTSIMLRFFSPLKHSGMYRVFFCAVFEQGSCPPSVQSLCNWLLREAIKWTVFIIFLSVVLPCILISTKLFCQQMRLLLKHKMLQFIFKIFFLYGSYMFRYLRTIIREHTTEPC